MIQEEKELERIQDSLRGKSHLKISQLKQRLTRWLVDKTQQFYDQKEALQKDLQPWTAKINTKQTEMDIARGEHDALVKKVESVQTDLQEAEEHLAKVKSEQEESKRLMDEAKKEKVELNSKKQAVNDKLSVRTFGFHAFLCSSC